jgi:hypothetical protein
MQANTDNIFKSLFWYQYNNKQSIAQYIPYSKQIPHTPLSKYIASKEERSLLSALPKVSFCRAPDMNKKTAR